jgi:hypothetical protein
MRESAYRKVEIRYINVESGYRNVGSAYRKVESGYRNVESEYRNVEIGYRNVEIVCVLSGRGLCDKLITRPEESYRLWRVVVCDQETS